MPRAERVSIDDDEFTVHLVDGRRLVVPLDWFERLRHATSEQLHAWTLIGDGEGIHWPELDEDLSVIGLLSGSRPAQGTRD